MTDPNATDMVPDLKQLTLPLSRREVVLALTGALASKKKADIKSSVWTQITISDGALD